ncbi:MAG TPA: hypothetical protein VEU47_19085 [Candidatus Cybelea sp.]|nr:hypothetical protein [Candidatus Cybelea sp.]
MALKTGGTNGTTTLQGLQWPSVYSGGASFPAATDIGNLANLIFDDQVPSELLGQSVKWTQRIVPGAFVQGGLLHIPNRGVLKILPGDWIFVDPSGWPILVADEAIPSTLTATANNTSGSPTITVTSPSTGVLNQGWGAGMAISGTGIPASSFIDTISADGLTLTIASAPGVKVNCTSSNTGITITAGSWTHS